MLHTIAIASWLKLLVKSLYLKQSVIQKLLKCDMIVAIQETFLNENSTRLIAQHYKGYFSKGTTDKHSILLPFDPLVTFEVHQHAEGVVLIDRRPHEVKHFLVSAQCVHGTLMKKQEFIKEMNY